VRAEETVRWTPEAEERMKRVPEQVKEIARTGVLRLALEKGHSVVTSAVIDEAMDRFMPKSASAATKALVGRLNHRWCREYQACPRPRRSLQ